jgi:hypothetical protein
MEMADARNHFFSQFTIFERSQQSAGGPPEASSSSFFIPFFVFRGEPSGGRLVAGYSLPRYLLDYKRRK